MAGLPTVTVKLDDASNGGTYPYDISTYTDIGRGQIQIVRGRTDELQTMQPSTLSLTLYNIDGRFTLGSTVGGYGAINADRRLQVSTTVGGVTSVRFTGYVQAWPVEWPTGSDQDALTTITATCRYAKFSRRVLRSQMEQQIRANQTITGYYTLSEAAGATTAANSATSGQDALTAHNVTFGSAGGPIGDGGLTAASIAGNGYLSGRVNDAASTAYAVGCWFSASAIPAFSATLVQVNQTYVAGGGLTALLSLSINPSTGTVVATATTDQGDSASATSPSNLCNGATHCVCAVFNSATGTVDLFVDQNAVVHSSAALTGDTMTFTDSYLWVGGTSGSPYFDLNGVISHVFNGPTLMTTIPSANAFAISTTGTGDTAYNALSAFEFSGMAAAETVVETAYQGTMAYYDFTGATLESYLAAAVLAEGGLAFIRGDGKGVFQNRYHRSQTTLNTVSLTADAIDPASKVVSDMQQVVNYAYGTRQNGTGQIIAQSASSIANHEQYPVSLDQMCCATDADMLDHCNWLVTTHGEPSGRYPTLLIDLLTQTQAIQQAVNGLEISDRLQITGMPAQAASSGTTADLIIEGWTEVIDSHTWGITFNTTPFALNPVWLLDDTTYSVEGTTTRLGY